MDTLDVQFIVLLCLFLGNILFGSFASLIGKVVGYYSNSEEAWTRRLKWTSFLMYIGTGILLSNSFIVLLPQADHEFEHHENHSNDENCVPHTQGSAKESGHHHDSFPIPEFTVLCGFFVAFVMQETVYFILSKFGKTSREARALHVRFCSCAKRHTECSRTFKDAKSDHTLFGMEKKLLESGRDQSVECVASNVLPVAEVPPNSELLRSSILAQSVANYGTVTNVTEPPVDAPLPVLTAPVLLEEERRLLLEQQETMSNQNKFLISSMLIVIELSLQYIFLGIHLGLRTESNSRWSYFFVVCLQTFLLTFSAGSYLAVGNLDASYVGLFIGLLSSVPPTGMIVVMVQKSAVAGIPHLAKAIVSAIACGALLYSTFYELLRQKGGVTGMTKFFAIILGASIQTALQYGILTV